MVALTPPPLILTGDGGTYTHPPKNSYSVSSRNGDICIYNLNLDHGLRNIYFKLSFFCIKYYKTSFAPKENHCIKQLTNKFKFHTDRHCVSFYKD